MRAFAARGVGLQPSADSDVTGEKLTSGTQDIVPPTVLEMSVKVSYQRYIYRQYKARQRSAGDSGQQVRQLDSVNNTMTRPSKSSAC